VREWLILMVDCTGKRKFVDGTGTLMAGGGIPMIDPERLSIANRLF
jgi:hypothetical protein